MKTILVGIMMVLMSQAHAEIYKWVDESGRVHFGDAKPEKAKSEEVTVEINTYTNVTYDVSIFESADRGVVMYSTEWCSFCKKAKRYFNEKGIPFTEYNIEKDERAKRRYDKMGATGVPVILVGKKRMNGFSVNGFQRIYQK